MASLRHLSTPKSYKDLQCAVGLLNYYRNHLHSYSERAHPILELLRGERGKNFVFPEEAVVVWKELVNELADGFALNHPSIEGQIRIYTDASDVALGGVLVEYPPGTDMDPTTANPTEFPQGKVIAFCSHTLTPAERNYTISDRELLAVVYAVEKFHTYLNRRFQVVTDHKALEWYHSIKSNRNKRLQRYAMFLSQYCMDLLYRSGPLNVVADAVSRLYMVNHTVKQPLDVEAHPAQLFVLNSATYTHVGVPLPLTRARAIVGQTVAVRSDSLDHFRGRFKVKSLITRHRYGYIVKVFPKSRQVRIHFAEGSEMNVVWARLQHIPFADYAAALSLHPKVIVDAQSSLPFLLREAQKLDKDLSQLLSGSSSSAKCRDHILKRWKLSEDQLSLDSSGLLRAKIGEASLLLIPRAHRPRYMSLAHNTIVEGGHRAAAATKEVLAKIAYWPGLSTDVANFCKSCHYCQIHSRQRLPKELPSGSLDVSYPFQRIAVDYLGPYNVTTEGNKYILVVIDHFTKYAMSFALPDRSAATVARCLFERVFCVFGFPESVLTDGAAELLDKTLHAMYVEFGIDQLVSTAYHAKGNSVVERLNGTLKAMIKKFKSATGRDWDLLVPSVTFAYNGAVNRSTGYSPYFLMFARDFRSPLAIAHGAEATAPAKNLEDYLMTMLDSIRTAYAVVHEKLFAKEAALKSSNSRILSSHPEVLYNVGDLVTWQRQYQDKDADKLLAQWTGPWRIVDRWGAGVYIESPSKMGGDYRFAPAAQLKRYFSRSDHFPEVIENEVIVIPSNITADIPSITAAPTAAESADLVVGGVTTAPNVEDNRSVPLVVGGMPKDDILGPSNITADTPSYITADIPSITAAPTAAESADLVVGGVTTVPNVEDNRSVPLVVGEMPKDDILWPSNIPADTPSYITADIPSITAAPTAAESADLVVGGVATAPDVEDNRSVPLAVGEMPKDDILGLSTAVRSTTTRSKAMRSNTEAKLCVGNRVQVDGSLFNEPGLIFKGTISVVHVGQRCGIAFDDGDHQVFDNKFITLIPSKD